jgi:hypothetical protein
MWTYNYSTCLYHHGVKGMRWGIRRHHESSGSERRKMSKAKKIAIGLGITTATIAAAYGVYRLTKNKSIKKVVNDAPMHLAKDWVNTNRQSFNTQKISSIPTHNPVSSVVKKETRRVSTNNPYNFKSMMKTRQSLLDSSLNDISDTRNIVENYNKHYNQVMNMFGSGGTNWNMKRRR